MQLSNRFAASPLEQKYCTFSTAKNVLLLSPTRTLLNNFFQHWLHIIIHKTILEIQKKKMDSQFSKVTANLLK